MARTRDLVALSAIFIAPLAAILVSQALQSPVAEVVSAPPAEVFSAPPPPAPLPAPEPPAAPVVAPEPVAPVIEPPAAPPAGRDPAQAMLLRDGSLVVETRADLAWASGRIAMKAEPGHLLASRPVRWDSLPEPARDLAGATVVVYDSDGSACVATVGAARLQLERTGDVYWTTDEEDVYATYAPPASRTVLRNMVQNTFADADDLMLLARQQASDGRACDGVWARRADLPAPIVFGRRDASATEAAALGAEALAVVRAQPEFAAMADDYARHLEGFDEDTRAEEPDWDAFVAANFAVTAWREIGGPRQIVSVELTKRDAEPCSSDFSESLVLLLERQGERLVRLDQPAWGDLAALMDIDRDGVLEAVTRLPDGAALATANPGRDAFAQSYAIDFFGCPC